MEIIIRFAIIIGWYLLITGSAIGFWSGAIWLIKRRYINEIGAGVSFAAVVLVATYLCSVYK